MDYLSVLAAGAAAWVFGAVWYGVMGKAWMAEAGLTDDTMNKKNVPAFVGSFICALLVAGMTRHAFVTAGVYAPLSGFISGLGLGLFIAAPWIVTNYLFAQRSVKLMLIDGVYAVSGCAIIGLVLTLI
ncbi:MAG: DUF1761 domain-containing protein [Pseudomonadota bacterium]